MDSKKVFIIILLLIGVLFVVGLNLGAFHTDNQNAQTPSWVSNFGAAIAPSQPLQLADLSPTSASCLQQENFVVQVGSPCTFSIKKAIFATRITRLQLLQGAAATATLSQEDTLTVQENIPTTDDNLKVYPGKTQGMLTLQCTDAGGTAPCLLRLK